MDREREAEYLEWLRKTAAENERKKIRNLGVDEPHASGRLTLRSYWSDEPTRQRNRERRAILRLEQWADEEAGSKRGVFLHGEPGLGKSHLAQAALVSAFRKTREPARFVTFEQVLKQVRATFDDPEGPRDSDVIERYARWTKWLVMDDLGASEKASDFSLRVMYEIINGRLRNNLPTILTANYALPDLMKRIMPKDKDGKAMGDDIEADRIVERIKELCDVVELTGDSYRR